MELKLADRVIICNRKVMRETPGSGYEVGQRMNRKVATEFCTRVFEGELPWPKHWGQEPDTERKPPEVPRWVLMPSK